MRCHWAVLALSALLYVQTRAKERAQEDGATCAVGVLPEVCKCRAGITLRCRSADLLHLPPLSDKLQFIELSDSRSAQGLPGVYKLRELRSLRVDHALLDALPADLCSSAPQLRMLDVMTNNLKRMPDLHMCVEMRFIELSWNMISTLDATSLRGLRKLQDLLLIGNRLQQLSSDVFLPTPELQLLNFNLNLIEHIDPEAFVPILKLDFLNVANNKLTTLPKAGLQNLSYLGAHNNPGLLYIYPDFFPNIKVISVPYPHQCCDFMSLPVENNARASDDQFSEWLIPFGNTTDVWDRLNTSDLTESQLEVEMERWRKREGNAGSIFESQPDRNHRRRPKYVRCYPLPGPFQPCVDLFDGWVLRGGAWCTVLLALLGNGTVLVVLVFAHRRMDVPRFLASNLAFADLCMGTYLGLLVVQDWRTLGQFREQAMAWKKSATCHFIGFLAVFSSEMSLYALTVITLERYWTITNIVVDRLSLRHAMYVMVVGCVFSLTVAALPLHGISDYGKSAICLPLETDTTASTIYVVGLIVINGMAFVVLFVSYTKIYYSIRDMRSWKSNECRIATNMALLVLTNFLCWAPVAFCALTAAAGAPLITPNQAKWLTVFVVPLNSCCNPFLYAIFTKQFKEECTLFCRAMQKLRVKRCIHPFDCEKNQESAECHSLDERPPMSWARQAAQRGDSPVPSVLVVEEQQESYSAKKVNINTIEPMYNETSF